MFLVASSHIKHPNLCIELQSGTAASLILKEANVPLMTASCGIFVYTYQRNEWGVDVCLFLSFFVFVTRPGIMQESDGPIETLRVVTARKLVILSGVLVRLIRSQWDSTAICIHVVMRVTRTISSVEGWGLKLHKTLSERASNPGRWRERYSLYCCAIVPCAMVLLL